MVDILDSGEGSLFMNLDPEEARQYFRQKSRKMTKKVMSATDAVEKFVPDGSYLASGGFGGVRIASELLHEIVRQRKKNLSLAGHTTTHDYQILMAGKCVSKVDVAYIVGLEARGLSPNARRVTQSGDVELVEWTNAALAWRLRAAVMGVPFIPARNMLGTDTYKYSGAKTIICPFTGRKLLALPALYPDVSLIHVHRCDSYGNAQIDGIKIVDEDLARASKRLIISTEKIVSNDEIRQNPDKTSIPFYCVDAVVESPYGSYPGNMPYEYFSDEEHIMEWLTVEKDEEKFAEFLDKNIYGVETFAEYIELNGGVAKMQKLRAQEHLINDK